MIEFLMLSFWVYLHVAEKRDVLLLTLMLLCVKNQWSNLQKKNKLLQPTKTTTFGAACRAAKSLRFWCLLLGLRLLALPPTTDSTMFFPMCFPEKKKKHVPQPWALAFPLNGISAPSWHLNRTQVFAGQMLCFTILEKERNVGTNTWPKRHRFHGSPNDFCSYYLAIYPFKSVTKAATGRWKHWWKTWIKSLIHISFISKQHRFCASTSASMIRCWGCYASVPLLKELASLPQHLTCRIFVGKRLSAEKSPPPFPCWDFWMVSPLRKKQNKKRAVNNKTWSI